MNVYSPHPVHINLSEGFKKEFVLNYCQKVFTLWWHSKHGFSLTLLVPLLINSKLILQIYQLTQ